ncbi:MAG TPA: ABC transporter substrate-binding protein [bacterium]|nr:ABC transporter substrate-binding protein [bacterium]
MAAAAVIGLCLLLVTWGAGPGSASAAATPGVPSATLTFGQTVPKSGPAALYGQSTYGVEAYFAYINDRSGVRGRKLRLISLDDKYQPAVSVQLTRDLLDKYRVFAEVAVNGSAPTEAVLTVLTPVNVPLIGPQSGATPVQSVFRKNLYNVWPSYVTEGKLLGKYAKDTLHLSRIGVLYQNDDFGKSLYDGVKEAGVTATVAIPYDPGQVDFGAQAEQFKSAGCDGVIILAIPGPTISFLNAMAAIDYKPARLMSQTSAIPQSFSAAKSEFPGSYIGAFIPPLTETSNPQVKLFLDSMAKYEPGKPASVFAAWGWTEAQVAVAGLKAIKGPITRDSYEAALDHITGLQTLGGDVTYTPTSHAGIQKMFMVIAKHGRLEPVPTE